MNSLIVQWAHYLPQKRASLTCRGVLAATEGAATPNALALPVEHGGESFAAVASGIFTITRLISWFMLLMELTHRLNGPRQGPPSVLPF
jgi:hypothetical protein